MVHRPFLGFHIVKVGKPLQKCAQVLDRHDAPEAGPAEDLRVLTASQRLFLREINVFIDSLRAISTVERRETQRRLPMPRITKRLVDATETQPTEYFVWDSEIPDFGLQVLPSGRRGYVVQYRAGRRSRRIGLGPSTVLTCEQAGNRDIAIVAAARNGEDPASERDAGRKAIAVRELAERSSIEALLCSGLSTPVSLEALPDSGPDAGELSGGSPS